jgi:hypothetical protein
MDRNMPLEPDSRDNERDTYRPDAGHARAQGTGAILAIVTVVVLIIVGIVYIWQPVA